MALEIKGKNISLAKLKNKLNKQNFDEKNAIQQKDKEIELKRAVRKHLKSIRELKAENDKLNCLLLEAEEDEIKTKIGKKNTVYQ